MLLKPNVQRHTLIFSRSDLVQSTQLLKRLQFSHSNMFPAMSDSFISSKPASLHVAFTQDLKQRPIFQDLLYFAYNQEELFVLINSSIVNIAISLLRPPNSPSLILLTT